MCQILVSSIDPKLFTNCSLLAASSSRLRLGHPYLYHRQHSKSLPFAATVLIFLELLLLILKISLEVVGKASVRIRSVLFLFEPVFLLIYPRELIFLLEVCLLISVWNLTVAYFILFSLFSLFPLFLSWTQLAYQIHHTRKLFQNHLFIKSC